MVTATLILKSLNEVVSTQDIANFVSSRSKSGCTAGRIQRPLAQDSQAGWSACRPWKPERRAKDEAVDKERPTMEMSRIDSDYSMVSFWPPGHLSAWWFSISDDWAVTDTFLTWFDQPDDSKINLMTDWIISTCVLCFHKDKEPKIHLDKNFAKEQWLITMTSTISISNFSQSYFCLTDGHLHLVFLLPHQ